MSGKKGFLVTNMNGWPMCWRENKDEAMLLAGLFRGDIYEAGEDSIMYFRIDSHTSFVGEDELFSESQMKITYSVPDKHDNEIVQTNGILWQNGDLFGMAVTADILRDEYYSMQHAYAQQNNWLEVLKRQLGDYLRNGKTELLSELQRFHLVSGSGHITPFGQHVLSPGIIGYGLPESEKEDHEVQIVFRTSWEHMIGYATLTSIDKIEDGKMGDFMEEAWRGSEKMVDIFINGNWQFKLAVDRLDGYHIADEIHSSISTLNRR